MVVSDGGERTKEDRIGDSLVGVEKHQRDSSLRAPPAAEPQNYRRERAEELRMTLTLTDHCSMTV